MSGRMKSFLIIFVIITVSIISFSVELELLSHPQNADVFVDKVWRGNTPVTVDLAPGKHIIKVNKNGYQSQEETIDIRMPTVIEYNLNPLEEISNEFPLVLYLTNYQQSGSRRILFGENEDQLIEALQKRFEKMGFSISVEKPVDEFDLIMDNISIYEMLSERHPQARLFMIVNALWSYSSFREKKITKLETQFRIYDPKNSITLGNFQDISESIGMLGTEITILQAVEKATQNFLDNIGNYMVERIRKDVKKPILALNERYEDGQLYLFKSDAEINEIKLYDQDESLVESENIPLDKIPVSVVFLVDRSGSNEKGIPLITSQIESLLQILPEGFEWSLMGFDDRIEIIQSFTDVYIQWEFAKEQIVSSGMTRLYDAIYNAATVLAKRPGLKILILLTNGIDSDYYDTGLGSIRTEDEALNAISRSGMIVYPIGVSQDNHESLLKKIAYLSATEYHDINNYQPDQLSNIIARDLTYTTAPVLTKENQILETFSINGYKFEKEQSNRFLNQISLIREYETHEQQETITEEVKEPEKESTVEVKEPTPEKIEETSEEISEIAEEKEQTEDKTEEVEKKPKFEKVSEQIEEKNTETVTQEPVEEPEKQTEPLEKESDSETQLETTSTEQKQELPKFISEESDENIIDYPTEFNQILNLKDITIFDLDANGNLVWAQSDILYFHIPDENRIAGISIPSGLKKISFHYPYLSILIENELKTMEITGDSVAEIGSIKIDLPLAYFKLINEEILLLCYENGLVKAFSTTAEKKNEWQLESGVLNQAVMDEEGRIILSTTTARVGWLENINDELNIIKIEKPVVGLCPFNVDQERFLIVDASGSVYFQRFENTKATIRNLNRGIVLKASFAEADNMLFANHWDKTLRGYRIFDLNENFLFRSKKGIETFNVDSYADKVLILTVDNELYFHSKNTTIPENLEKIYSVE
ncbi:MAG: VWA domain-containing protein, partial [Thermotogota bacterium]|nr:VWA domain-containing protein [Thermotogota bacterium]